MTDTLREALEQMLRDVSRYFAGDHVNADVVLGQIRRRLPDALAASSPPARTEWRVVWRESADDRAVFVGSEVACRRWLCDRARLCANWTRDFGTEVTADAYVLQRCEAGPWRDVPDERDALHELKCGPRAYTPEQADVIERAVAERRPLDAPPLPLPDEGGEG